MRFLVTAGNTREAIDQVRDWGNIFTGNTGFAIAQVLARVGEVDLLTSNGTHLSEAADPVRASGFKTHAELRDRIEGLLGQHSYDAVFMTAAVSDYQPARVYAVVQREPDPHDPRTERWVVRDAQAAKIKSGHEQIAVLGRRTEKIVDLFRSKWGYQGILVKFKLEVGIGEDELLNAAEASRVDSGAQYIVANTLDMVGEAGGAYLLWQGGHEWVPRGQLPGRMAVIATEKRGAQKR